MDETLPKVTVVIAARPGQADVKAVTGSRALDYPAGKLEIIVARGKQPSIQRNAAIKAASGEWIYFLDDDSIPAPGNLRLAARYFANTQVMMVGGPNLCPPEAPELEQVFALVLASRLAFGPSSARYAAVGRARVSSEKELILCNLLARRAPMLDLGGFNEALYPNEENALMDELQERGGKLMYEPELIVHRRPRGTLGSFSRMLMTYGRGRAEQFRVHPTTGSMLNFMPPLFCIYLLATCAALLTVPRLGYVLLAPLALYALVVAGQVAVLVAGGTGLKPVSGATGLKPVSRVPLFRRILRAVAAAPLIVLTHILYGLGFWRGLLTRFKSPGERAAVRVDLEMVMKHDSEGGAGPAGRGAGGRR